MNDKWLNVLKEIQLYCGDNQKNKCIDCRYNDEAGCKLQGKNPMEWYLMEE